ncbi:MAG: ribonuclease P protein component [Candidatus Buchananbacteria bacterium]|nr:ribonuclease P protein component [Candidatus Buchananbacteria bacterium]
MLPTSYRLTQEKDFRRITVSGKSFFSHFFRLRLAKNNLKISRFAVVISSRVSKKAVMRNRLKRQLREIIRLNLAKIKGGFDVVVSSNSKALDANYQELEQQLLQLLRKSHLL